MEQNRTELVFILDKSGSMGGLESDTLGGYNAMLKDQRKAKGECVLTTILFNNTVECIHDRLNINAIKPLTDNDYKVGGSTALLDAIGGSIQKIINVQKNSLPQYQSQQVIFVIITDGYENSSSDYTSFQIKQLIETQTKEYKWEFIFLGANIDAVQTAQHFGIEKNRAQDFVADTQGVTLNFEAMSHAVKSFRQEQSIPEDWNEAIKEDFETRN